MRRAGSPTQQPESLAGIGLTPLDEAVYRDAIRTGRFDLTDSPRRLRATPHQVTKTLERLEALGLMTRTSARPVQWLPAQPDVAIEVLATQQKEQIERARRAAVALAAQFHESLDATRSTVPLEVISQEAVHLRWSQLQASAKDEIRILDVPPYVVTADTANTFALDALRRGVRCRVLYDVTSFDHPGKREWMQRGVAEGEQARVLEGLPIKAILSDRHLAILFESNPGGSLHAFAVHPSPMLDVLGLIFEDLWSRATPVRGEGTGTHELEVQVLTLMARGLKDEAIARQLGLHLRTVRRHVASAMRELGAGTRFQAGAEASRRGLI